VVVALAVRTLVLDLELEPEVVTVPLPLLEPPPTALLEDVAGGDVELTSVLVVVFVGRIVVVGSIVAEISGGMTEAIACDGRTIPDEAHIER